MGGWSDLGVPNGAPQSKTENMQVKIFDHFKKVSEMTTGWEHDSKLQKKKVATGTQMDKIIVCILDVLEAIHDMNYSILKDREALRGLAEAAQQLPTAMTVVNVPIAEFAHALPINSVPTLVDAAVLSADALLTGVESFKKKHGGPARHEHPRRHPCHFTYSQTVVIEYLARSALPPEMTVSQWAQGLWPIAEEAMGSLKTEGNKKGEDTESKLFGAYKASKVSQINLEAIALYVNEVRPVLYFYMTAGTHTLAHTVQ